MGTTIMGYIGIIGYIYIADFIVFRAEVGA